MSQHIRFRARRGTAAVMLVALLAALVLAVAGCGSSSSSSSTPAGSSTTSGAQTTPKTHFAKTKFVIHAGLAFGAFHRYIYKPFKAGGFTPPSSHKLALLKAGAAALFAYHEAKLALVDAQSSPLLSKLVSPITAFQAKLSALGTKLKGGQVDAGTINSANSDTSTISSKSAAQGQPITEQTSPVPGA